METSTVRFAVSTALLVVLVCFNFRAMLYFLDLQEHSSEIYGNSWMSYYPTIMYSLTPVVTELVFDPLAEFLNKLENHISEVYWGLFV
jgi:hypothetical protein